MFALGHGRSHGTESGEALPPKEPDSRSDSTMQADSRMQADETRSRCWLAAYTRSRHEQQVATQLQQKNLQHLLPTYNKMKRFDIPRGTGRLSSELAVEAAD